MPPTTKKVTSAPEVDLEVPSPKGAEEQAPEIPAAEKSAKEIPAAVTSSAPTRKVRGLKNHVCNIGGKKVFIEKDKETVVSVDTAQILQRAGKVLIL